MRTCCLFFSIFKWMWEALPDFLMKFLWQFSVENRVDRLRDTQQHCHKSHAIFLMKMCQLLKSPDTQRAQNGSKVRGKANPHSFHSASLCHCRKASKCEFFSHPASIRSFVCQNVMLIAGERDYQWAQGNNSCLNLNTKFSSSDFPQDHIPPRHITVNNSNCKSRFSQRPYTEGKQSIKRGL